MGSVHQVNEMHNEINFDVLTEPDDDISAAFMHSKQCTGCLEMLKDGRLQWYKQTDLHANRIKAIRSVRLRTLSVNLLPTCRDSPHACELQQRLK